MRVEPSTIETSPKLSDTAVHSSEIFLSTKPYNATDHQRAPRSEINRPYSSSFEEIREDESFVPTDLLPEDERPHYSETDQTIEVSEDEEVYFTTLEALSYEGPSFDFDLDAKPASQDEQWQRQQLLEDHFSNNDGALSELDLSHFAVHADRDD